MRILILMGSFRPRGNTAALLDPFIKELKSHGADVGYITLCEKEIAPCDACWACQDAFDGYGCPKADDMQMIFDEVLKADCFVLATPIYTWYCTPPMKAMLDRFYGMNKYYGSRPGPCLWQGKKCAIIATCGYDIEYGTSPFEDGIKRLCEHSHLDYIGKLAVRDIDDRASFETSEAKEAAVAFAHKVIADCK